MRWTGPPGWGSGRQAVQPVTAKMLTVRKPKLWLRNSQNEWNRLGEWERNNEMRMATWNGRTLYTYRF